MKNLYLVLFVSFLSSTIATAEEPNADDLLKMDQVEKDKLLSCTEIVSTRIKRDEKIIQDISSQIAARGVSNDIANHKITGDMLNKCYYSIEDDVYPTIFYNGQFMEAEITEELLEFSNVDYSVYKQLTPQEFSLSPETQLLFMKLEKARNEFMTNNRQKTESGRNDFKIFNHSLKDIPVGVNLLLAIVVLGSMFIGISYALKTLSNDDRKHAGVKLPKNKKGAQFQ